MRCRLGQRPEGRRWTPPRQRLSARSGRTGQDVVSEWRHLMSSDPARRSRAAADGGRRQIRCSHVSSAFARLRSSRVRLDGVRAATSHGYDSGQLKDPGWREVLFGDSYTERGEGQAAYDLREAPRPRPRRQTPTGASLPGPYPRRPHHHRPRRRTPTRHRAHRRRRPQPPRPQTRPLDRRRPRLRSPPGRHANPLQPPRPHHQSPWTTTCRSKAPSV